MSDFVLYEEISSSVSLKGGPPASAWLCSAAELSILKRHHSIDKTSLLVCSSLYHKLSGTFPFPTEDNRARS